MDSDKKYFGMTTMQIGILAGLAGALLLVLCVGGWLVLRNVIAAPALSAKLPTNTPEPTVTPMDVVPPTATATLPATPVPYEQLIPSGWKQFKTSLVEVWMPSNFKLADSKTKKSMSGLVPLELLITEVPSKSSAYNMLVWIGYAPLSGNSLDKFLDAKLQSLTSNETLADRRTVQVNSVEARRIMLEVRDKNIIIDDLVYVFLDGSTVWTVEYIAEINEFFTNLPTFEQSIKTFRIVR